MCQLALIFSTPCPPTNLLLLVLIPVSNFSMTRTCRLGSALVGARNLVVCVHGPLHSRRPLECGWLVAYAYLLVNTSTHYNLESSGHSGLLEI